MEFLFQDIHGHIRLFHNGCLLLRLRKRTLVHFLVLVEWNGVNLHRYRGHHVRRFLVKNKLIECLDIDLLVAYDVGRDELASAILVESLNRSILDVGELADDALHLLELDAEAANLHLAVASSHKLDVTIGQETHDVARAVDALVFFVGGEGVGDVNLSRLLRTVQIAPAHLWSGNPKFTGCTYGQTMPLCINHIETYVVERLSDGNFLHLLLNAIYRDENGTLRRTIGIEEFIACGRCEGSQFLATR